MRLLHKGDRFRFRSPIGSQNLNGALAGVVVKAESAPLISEHSESLAVLTALLYLFVSLLQPSLCRRPMEFAGF
ncbi:hypothetical protein FF1_042070 [Malus domestica]